MGRNDRAGFQVWSAADGYPGDGCTGNFIKKMIIPVCIIGGLQVLIQIWVTKCSMILSLAISRINENSDHYTNLLYHMLK